MEWVYLTFIRVKNSLVLPKIHQLIPLKMCIKVFNLKLLGDDTKCILISLHSLLQVAENATVTQHRLLERDSPWFNMNTILEYWISDVNVEVSS